MIKQLSKKAKNFEGKKRKDNSINLLLKAYITTSYYKSFAKSSSKSITGKSGHHGLRP